MPRTKSVISVTFWLTLTFTGGLFASFAGIYLYLAPKLPDVETLKETKFQIPLRIYTRDGQLIGEFGEKRRSPITFAEIPKNYIDAILSAEDDRFYSHRGVDLKGLLRAVSQILQTGEIQGGGSTITMQVARNFFLTREQVFTRKFNEILLALQIEKELTKDEILTLYVNKIYLGNRAYGIQAAAQIYYGKNIAELSLAQIAMIAGLPKAPSAYNPLANPSRALIRRNWILSRMYELGRITEEQYQAAAAEPITAKNHGSVVAVDAPYVAEMARKQMIDKYGLDAYTDGYQAYVSVDSRLQLSAQKAVVEGLEEYDQRHGYRGPESKLPVLGSSEALWPEPFTPAENDATSDELITEAPTENSGDLTAHPAAEESPEIEQPLPESQLYTTAEFDREEWLKQLKAIPAYAGRIPAAITRINSDHLTLLLASGEELPLNQAQGFDKVRAYLSENSRGAIYAELTEFLALGDVIRLKADGDSWQLSQIPAAQGALVALDPDDGAIRALVGGYDFRQSHFNRAVQAARQPGSNFKPFIYSIALQQGFTPASIINDAPIVFDDDSLEGTWRPENSSGRFYGPTRLREALYNSRNLVSIRLLRSVGIENALTGLSHLGFDRSAMPRDLSLALGSYALTPVELATGYTILANGGYKVSPYLLDAVKLSDDEVIYQANPVTVCDNECQQEKERKLLADQAAAELALLDESILTAEPDTTPEPSAITEQDVAAASTIIELDPTIEADPNSDQPQIDAPLPEAPRVMDERVNYLINSMLRDVITRGTGRKARVLERSDLAGKTGTTNGPTDAWFSGFNSHLVATTWVGFDQNQLLGTREFGGSAALPIWINFMADALANVPEDQFRQPDGIVSIKIDPETGERARSDDPDAIFEVFREENAPPPLDEAGEASEATETIEELF
ncbi:penicillin-binding protein 1A [Halioxenophilus sp. WMMB6]|uniref:penicillin-binding protein 1A n=1 Tax=Halioxenophilus sp. WMMB6 TaxID=3073815 RepID=UPI00295E2E6F|nr:penicillin-binding protein 1A [Halioxenophilus sp. WMMB6]